MIHKSSRVEFHPLGVIGAIVSWNYPFHNIFNPMLASVFPGNGIVIKVSEHASWYGCFYLRIIQAALAVVGAPENLVDVITGFSETGEALVSSVDKIVFVGSPGVAATNGNHQFLALLSKLRPKVRVIARKLEKVHVDAA